ncbi:hypothetical protein [Niveispirillum irakense]|uniref:hypothetical protein n=1 Tax=Niveispirillum irakense TaxID=34011 RepID=UPI0003FCC5F0|nr:hypothetical protein [Niveispirillum irakense]
MAGNHGPALVSDKIVREHAEGWHAFTRFTTISIIVVTLILLMFLLHFFVGWGYAVFFMLLGFVATAILALLGKV